MFKRVSFFVYGCVSYLLFLATFSYAIAFVEGVGVPTRLDGVPVGPLATSLLIDAALLTVFAAQHSVMARRGFKTWWTRIVPLEIERSTFVLFASAALMLLLWQWRPLGGVVWQVDHAASRAALFAISASGWGLVLVATFLINHFDLFGLRQAWFALRGQPYQAVPLATPWLYRVVRHPLYLGFLIAFWAAPTMTLAHLVFAVATSAYILIAIQLEERDLVTEHGAGYETYRRRVPMLLPGARPAARHLLILLVPATAVVGLELLARI
jgi:protein-S-isoprenylcysteine O-methyltransferase Ste14